MDVHSAAQRELAPRFPLFGNADRAGPNPVANPLRPNLQSFRRHRKGRACWTCHSRRIRCDAATLGVPCTNCTAFAADCFIPARKKKRRAGEPRVEGTEAKRRPSLSRNHPSHRSDVRDAASRNTSTSRQDSASLEVTPREPSQDPLELYAQLIQPDLSEAPIREGGRVAYVSEQTGISLLMQDHDSPANSDIVHYPLPESFKVAVPNPSHLDELEISILQRQGALSLPPKELCDELIESYFIWIAPLVPVINRSDFMRRYNDPNNQPSLLLLHAIFLAGSRVCTTVQLMDSNGSPISAATLFYRRVKALYDAGYEQDRVTLVQTLILMGWYWEESGKVTKNVFYWVGLAITLAQGFGMHRNADQSRLSNLDKKLWKRIWWTLFTRDRSVAVAMGRPVYINLEETDVPMLSEDDFVEDDHDNETFPPDPIHVQFFLQYIKVCQIMDLILIQHYSITSRTRRHHALALTQCDMSLADWLEECPEFIRWDPARYEFWSALLHCFYHTASCLLHRAHLPAPPPPGAQDDPLGCEPWPRRNPAFHSACEITAVIECMIIHNELCNTPPFMVYSLMSTLLVHIYEMHTAAPETYVSLQKRLWVCMHALRKISNVWLVAKMAHKLFEQIISTAGFEDCLRGPSNEVHKKRRAHSSSVQGENSDSTGSSTQRESGTSTPKAWEPALTPALLESMDAALKSLSISENPHRALPGMSFNVTTMGPRPLNTHHFNESTRSSTDPKTPESQDYSHLMATLQPHEIFSKNLPWNVPVAQPSSDSSSMSPTASPPTLSTQGVSDGSAAHFEGIEPNGHNSMLFGWYNGD
ncbi:fungal specific transcription factor domain-containing protein [Phlyctema vagabunda]|uniref:Fungal specific transcription factor domain-containing protein n=1 Tax=Phlyctema vagabunda TaxID=108571 RepID=A0ABR4P1Y9_9HELO